jgi:hypothetical protein
MSSENIIDPAPAQTFLQNSQSNDKREDEIKRLREYLRRIDNICEPMTEYTIFQRNINPQIRMFIDIDKMMMVIYALKSAVKMELDEKYTNINNPSDSLRIGMENTYNNMDRLTQSLSDSMKQIIDLLQLTVFDFKP